VSGHVLSKAVRSAINRNAQRIARTKAYVLLRSELEARAAEWRQQGDSEEALISRLNRVDIPYGPQRNPG
jgi:hypothetical protein